jgi:hypothetical protein
VPWVETSAHFNVSDTDISYSLLCTFYYYIETTDENNNKKKRESSCCLHRHHRRRRLFVFCARADDTEDVEIQISALFALLFTLTSFHIRWKR